MMKYLFLFVWILGTTSTTLGSPNEFPRRDFEEALYRWLTSVAVSLESDKILPKYANCQVNTSRVQEQLDGLIEQAEWLFVKDLYKCFKAGTPRQNTTVHSMVSSWIKVLDNLTSSIYCKHLYFSVSKREMRKIKSKQEVKHALSTIPKEAPYNLAVIHQLTALLKNSIDTTHISYIKTTDEYNKVLKYTIHALSETNSKIQIGLGLLTYDKDYKCTMLNRNFLVKNKGICKASNTPIGQLLRAQVIKRTLDKAREYNAFNYIAKLSPLWRYEDIQQMLAKDYAIYLEFYKQNHQTDTIPTIIEVESIFKWLNSTIKE